MKARKSWQMARGNKLFCPKRRARRAFKLKSCAWQPQPNHAAVWILDQLTLQLVLLCLWAGQTIHLLPAQHATRASSATVTGAQIKSNALQSNYSQFCYANLR
eukprot:1161071-Pelagomonas_calceolata.AAC.12